MTVRRLFAFNQSNFSPMKACVAPPACASVYFTRTALNAFAYRRIVTEP